MADICSLPSQTCIIRRGLTHIFSLQADIKFQWWNSFDNNYLNGIIIANRFNSSKIIILCSSQFCR